MRKKVESLKNKELKQKIMELIEESNGEIKFTESKDIKTGEEFSIPIYIDLEGYTNERLSEIIEDNLEDIIEGLKEDDYFSTLSMVFFQLEEKEININFKVSNRDSEGEECINIIISY